MEYDGSKSWNMVKLAAVMFFKAKYVSVGAFLWTWLPFLVLGAIIVVPTLLM